MMNSIPRDWRIHGVFAQSQFMAGVLPRNGLHFFAGQQGHERDAVLADIATAIASDVVVCGLGAADKAGARSSLAGFFGLATGAACGVAVVTGKGRAEALSRNIAANALARSVSRQLPVAVMGLAGTGVDHLTGAHARLSELAELFEKERGVELGLVILDGLALPAGEIDAFCRAGRAVLVVSESAPAGVADETVILEIGDGRITAAKTASGETWARELELEVVKVQGVESLVVKPGKAVEPQPIWCAAPVVAVAPVAKEPEPPIVSRVALVVSRGELDPKVRMKWAGQGFDVVQSQEAALPQPGELVGGRREIVVAGEDQLPAELKARVTRLKEDAIRLGVADVVTIRVAA